MPAATNQPATWQNTLESARSALATLERARTELIALGDAATADITRFLRVESDVDIDSDAIRATLTRPYTLLPINQQEAWLVHWRGIRMPIFGWVVKQEAAFTVSRLSRGMDLLTPLPPWMKEEMGWRPPEHGALLSGDKSTVKVTSGDESTFRQRYGAHLGHHVEGGFQIKQGTWIKLVAQLIRDGILPYAPQPVAKADWHASAASSVVLRDYQESFVREFLSKGAVFWNLPPGGGKTYLTLYVLARLRGKVLLFAPSIILCEQWRERLNELVPTADVTILTYAAGRKALDQEWALVIFDEVQTLPADTFSKLAFLKTKYRIGLSGSPWREDGRQHMIAALSGFPCAIRWSELIRAGVLRRPRVIVATVPSDAAKTAFVQKLVSQRRAGRVLIFCDFLERGQALANALEVPFVSGETAQKFKRVQEAEVCVVSRIADRGLDFPDLALVIEVAFLGGSREQEAQRLGRLLHSQSSGEHYLLFTPEEAARYRPRIYGIEAELAGEVDLEFVTMGNAGSVAGAARQPASGAPRPMALKSRMVRQPSKPSAAKQSAATDPASLAMQLPPIAAKLERARVSVGKSSEPYVVRVFRMCFEAAFSPREIAEGTGSTGKWVVDRFAAACKALVKVGLFKALERGRYVVDVDEVNRLRALASAVTKRK